MKRNILFIDPPGAYSRMVNTGLGYIASSLKKNSNCNFKVLDLNNFRGNRDKILKNAFNMRDIGLRALHRVDHGSRVGIGPAQR